VPFATASPRNMKPFILSRVAVLVVVGKAKNFLEIKKKRFDKSQYEILIRCSEKKDLNEWNERRKNIEEAPILLEGAELDGVDLQGADLSNAYLLGAELCRANLKGANLFEANLKNAELMWTNLEGADLTKANLYDADLWRANLKGARLVAAIVNARTFIWGCEFDTQTDFMGMKVDLARIDPRLKESLRTDARLIQ